MNMLEKACVAELKFFRILPLICTESGFYLLSYNFCLLFLKVKNVYKPFCFWLARFCEGTEFWQLWRPRHSPWNYPKTIRLQYQFY